VPRLASHAPPYVCAAPPVQQRAPLEARCRLHRTCAVVLLDSAAAGAEGPAVSGAGSSALWCLAAMRKLRLMCAAHLPAAAADALSPSPGHLQSRAPFQRRSHRPLKGVVLDLTLAYAVLTQPQQLITSRCTTGSGGMYTLARRFSAGYSFRRVAGAANADACERSLGRNLSAVHRDPTPRTVYLAARYVLFSPRKGPRSISAVVRPLNFLVLNCAVPPPNARVPHLLQCAALCATAWLSQKC
jgi:hypothetical protein